MNNIILPGGNKFMDAITAVLQHLYFNIPREVLISIFNPYQRQLSLDRCIVMDIIEGKILSDINRNGGSRTSIILREENAVFSPAPLPYSMVSGTYSVYRIPPNDREHRNIASVSGLRYPYNYNAYNSVPSPFVNGRYGASMGDLASAALNAQTMANIATIPTPRLLQGNMISLEPVQLTHIDWVLDCRLEWDKNFTSMDNTLIEVFVDLVYTAVRGYIYTQGIFNASRIYLSGGQELNVMKEIIESGKDFLDQYPEKLKNFCGATILSRNEIGKLLTYMV